MNVYFSHSYRDRAINVPFLQRFVEEEIPLVADQKSDVWCVAKLERYMRETTGFVSIIPRREPADPGSYSPYIGYELDLARRARVPRLLFVDEQVLNQHRLKFPRDAVPFRPADLEKDSSKHAEAIRTFGRKLEEAHRAPKSSSTQREATVVVGTGKALRGAAEDVGEILRRRDFSVTVLDKRWPGRGLDDIRLLETLRSSEVCAFVLGASLSEAHIALALAHADCIPSIRLLHDPEAPDTEPTLAGLLRWKKLEEMHEELSKQLDSYENGLVKPVELALASGADDAVRSLSTMKYRSLPENRWDIENGPALIEHVHPDFSFVRDEVDRARAQLNRALGRVESREDSLELATLLYDGVRRLNFLYEHDQRTDDIGIQAIRTPKQIKAHYTATCIDAACLFASLLESAEQNPLLVVIQGRNFAHALAGYRVRGEPSWNSASLLDLRGAVARRDAVLFEATGVLAADAPVGAEKDTERVDKVLNFVDARTAAVRMLERSDIELKHFVDVRATREQRST